MTAVPISGCQIPSKEINNKDLPCDLKAKLVSRSTYFYSYGTLIVLNKLCSVLSGACVCRHQNSDCIVHAAYMLFGYAS